MSFHGERGKRKDGWWKRKIGKKKKWIENGGKGRERQERRVHKVTGRLDSQKEDKMGTTPHWSPNGIKSEMSFGFILHVCKRRWE